MAEKVALTSETEDGRVMTGVCNSVVGKVREKRMHEGMVPCVLPGEWIWAGEV